MSPVPVDITFRNMLPSPMVEVFIRRWATRLGRLSDHIEGCQVVVELPHRHHEQGRAFHVRVRLSVPGREIAITQEPGADGAHEDVYVAVRDSFRAARRQLEEHTRRSRAHVAV